MNNTQKHNNSQLELTGEEDRILQYIHQVILNLEMYDDDGETQEYKEGKVLL